MRFNLPQDHEQHEKAAQRDKKGNNICYQHTGLLLLVSVANAYAFILVS